MCTCVYSVHPCVVVAVVRACVCVCVCVCVRERERELMWVGNANDCSIAAANTNRDTHALHMS